MGIYGSDAVVEALAEYVALERQTNDWRNAAVVLFQEIRKYLGPDTEASRQSILNIYFPNYLKEKSGIVTTDNPTQ